ncbi:hypothetical protein GCM10009754_39110 [Amycolatopsis minnesotensis]|uniref:Uncharacterized protein n=1 Tax=Amycolatopsis minnesotensis TaxID=337894 RepID=A0ABP5CIV2_9PSEU
MIEALPHAELPVTPLGIAMNSTTAPALTSAQRAWVTFLATTITLLSVIVLGIAG